MQLDETRKNSSGLLLSGGVIFKGDVWYWTPPYTVERIANNPKDSRVTRVLIQADRPKNAGFRRGVAIVVV